jgi:hypothetical protein
MRALTDAGQGRPAPVVRPPVPNPAPAQANAIRNGRLP